jgi:peptide subunit release factor 1 (eRF1)
MAGTITPELLRELAEFRPSKGRAVSLYLNLDPSIAPTQPDVAARINSLLDEAAKRADELRDDLTHDEREGLKADLERMRSWFANEFDRDGARGAAVFAAGLDGLWAPLTVSEPVQEEVRIGDDLHLAPLLPAVPGGEPILVAYVGRERAEVYRLRGGTLEEIADETEDVPNKQKQGGWSQARYERRVENAVGQHLRRVAETLDGCVRELRDPGIVLLGTEETRGEFEQLLSNEAAERVAGWTTAERHASPAELLESAEPVIAAWRAGRETELVARWQESAARDGRASSGWADTLAAASDGRVDVLLVEEGANRPAYRCPQCGRAEAAAGSCPLDGTTLEERPDGLDLAVHQTLAHGGSVQVLRARRDLDPVEGIGALLRF